ncbi:MAG: hypothetical protein U0N28_04180 [Megasphaera massiliensis]
MISDGYSATLKKLISFTQAKFIALADVVGYDVSYVNKWSNVQSCRLPAM